MQTHSVAQVLARAGHSRLITLRLLSGRLRQSVEAPSIHRQGAKVMAQRSGRQMMRLRKPQYTFSVHLLRDKSNRPQYYFLKRHDNTSGWEKILARTATIDHRQKALLE